MNSPVNHLDISDQLIPCTPSFNCFLPCHSVVNNHAYPCGLLFMKKELPSSRWSRYQLSERLALLIYAI